MHAHIVNEAVRKITRLSDFPPFSTFCKIYHSHQLRPMKNQPCPFPHVKRATFSAAISRTGANSIMSCLRTVNNGPGVVGQLATTHDRSVRKKSLGSHIHYRPDKSCDTRGDKKTAADFNVNRTSRSRRIQTTQ